MLDWLKLIRASGLITIVANLLAAITVIVYQGESMELKVLISLLIQGKGATCLWLLLASACLYLSGMVWNDLADLERDRVLHPRRPLPAGRIPLARAFLFGTAVVALALIAAAFAGGGLAFQAAGLVLSLALFYDFSAKQVPWLGSAVMASVRASHAFLALFLIGTDSFLRASATLLSVLGADLDVVPTYQALVYPGLLACYIFGVTLTSELESRRGRRWELALGLACIAIPMVLALGRVASAPWIGYWQERGDYLQLVASLFLGLIIASIWVWRVGSKLWAALRIGRRGVVGPAVGASLGGMVLFDALIATSAHPAIGLIILLLYPLIVVLGRAVRMD